MAAIFTMTDSLLYNNDLIASVPERNTFSFNSYLREKNQTVISSKNKASGSSLKDISENENNITNGIKIDVVGFYKTLTGIFAVARMDQKYKDYTLFPKEGRLFTILSDEPEPLTEVSLYNDRLPVENECVFLVYKVKPVKIINETKPVDTLINILQKPYIVLNSTRLMR